MPEVNTTAKKSAKTAADALNSINEVATDMTQDAIHNAQAATHAVNSAAAQSAKAANDAARSMFPHMDVSRVEIPAAYRDMAEKGIAQAKQNYERAKVVTDQASDMLETTFNTATKSMSEYTVRVMEAMRANTNANFDFARSLLSVKSPSEVVELSTAHARKQFETMATQGKDLATLAQKLSTETVQPVRAGMDKALRAVA